MVTSMHITTMFLAAKPSLTVQSPFNETVIIIIIIKAREKKSTHFFLKTRVFICIDSPFIISGAVRFCFRVGRRGSTCSYGRY